MPVSDMTFFFACGIPLQISGISYTGSFYFEIFLWVGLKVIYCEGKILHPFSTVS